IASGDDDLLEATRSGRVRRLVLSRLVLGECARRAQRQRSHAERRAWQGWVAHTYPLLKSLHESKTAAAACDPKPTRALTARSSRNHNQLWGECKFKRVAKLRGEIDSRRTVSRLA